MKFYIAGKITGNPDYKKQFAEAEQKLKEKGHSVMNPAWLNESPEFTWEDYMYISNAMQMKCDSVFFLDNWKNSTGAQIEAFYARLTKQQQFFSLDDVPQNKV